MKINAILFVFLLYCPASLAFSGSKIKPHLPDEFESSGGHSLGFDNAAMAAVSGQASVRINPAMLSFEKQYNMSAAYHWPTFGREFYQLGVVDSKTSPVAAGVLYTSSEEKYKNPDHFQQDDQRLNAYYDSPVKRRIALGLSQSFDKLALGVSGQFVEFYDENEKMQKGSTFGLGVAGLLTKSLRFGFAAENLANRKVKEVSPRTIRAGLAYTVFDGNVTAHLDAKQRNRVELELPMQHSFAEKELTNFLDSPLRVYTASFSARVQDLLRLLFAYSMNEEEQPRFSIAGGLALVNKGFSFSYMLRRPDTKVEKTHQAINLSLALAL